MGRKKRVGKSEGRAAYGREVLRVLSERLAERYGKGFSVTNLRSFRRFYKTFATRRSGITVLPGAGSDDRSAPDEGSQMGESPPNRHKLSENPGTASPSSIGSSPGDELESHPETVSRSGEPASVTESLGCATSQAEPFVGFAPRLSWTHYRTLTKVAHPAERNFYEIESNAQGWSARQLFLSDNSLEWSRKEQELDRIDRMWKVKFSTDVLRDGLNDERDRWLALQIIHEHQVRALLPDVRRAHAKKPDHSTIAVLANLGSEEDLEALRVSIGSLVDIEARKRISLSEVNVFGPEHKHGMEYGQIVRAMARLATPEAIAAIKSAMVDYDPHLRAAGCDAVAHLKVDVIDDEIRGAIRARLKESLTYVSEAARAAARAHGIQD